MANISIAGGTSPTVAVYGKNLGVTAGLGTDSVGSTSVTGTVSLGGVSTTGNDTISLGSGSDTIVQSGQATVSSAFNTLLGASSITGGALAIAGTTLGNAQIDVNGVVGATLETTNVTLANAGADVNGVMGGVRSDVATVIGGALDEARVTAQNGRADVAGVFSGVKMEAHALVGSAGADTLTGGTGSSPFEFLGSDAAGQHTITNFVSPDPMYVEGYSLSYLQANHDISTQGGNTLINIDGGKTTIELKGIGGLNSTEITHKT